MLFAAYIAVEQEVIMIAFSTFTRFWCTPTHVKSKPSSDFWFKTRTPEVGLQSA